MTTRTDAFMFLMDVDAELARALAEEPLSNESLVSDAPNKPPARTADKIVSPGPQASLIQEIENLENRIAELRQLERNYQEAEQARSVLVANLEKRITKLRNFERDYSKALLHHLHVLEERAPDEETLQTVRRYIAILTNPNGSSVMAGV